MTEVSLHYWLLWPMVCYRAQMPFAVLCQGLAVRATFPNLLAEFAPAHTPFSKALFPTYFERVVQKKDQTSPPSPSSFASIWYLSFSPINLGHYWYRHYAIQVHKGG